MPFVVAVTFIIDLKVHLLLDDIVTVAAEGDEGGLGGPQTHRIPFRYSDLHNMPSSCRKKG